MEPRPNENYVVLKKFNGATGDLIWERGHGGLTIGFGQSAANGFTAWSYEEGFAWQVWASSVLDRVWCVGVPNSTAREFATFGDWMPTVRVYDTRGAILWETPVIELNSGFNYIQTTGRSGSPVRQIDRHPLCIVDTNTGRLFAVYDVENETENTTATGGQKVFCFDKDGSVTWTVPVNDIFTGSAIDELELTNGGDLLLNRTAIMRANDGELVKFDAVTVAFGSFTGGDYIPDSLLGEQNETLFDLKLTSGGTYGEPVAYSVASGPTTYAGVCIEVGVDTFYRGGPSQSANLTGYRSETRNGIFAFPSNPADPIVFSEPSFAAYRTTATIDSTAVPDPSEVLNYTTTLVTDQFNVGNVHADADTVYHLSDQAFIQFDDITRGGSPGGTSTLQFDHVDTSLSGFINGQELPQKFRGRVIITESDSTETTSAWHEASYNDSPRWDDSQWLLDALADNFTEGTDFDLVAQLDDTITLSFGTSQALYDSSWTIELEYWFDPLDIGGYNDNVGVMSIPYDATHWYRASTDPDDSDANIIERIPFTPDVSVDFRGAPEIWIKADVEWASALGRVGSPDPEVQNMSSYRVTDSSEDLETVTFVNGSRYPGRLVFDVTSQTIEISAIHDISGYTSVSSILQTSGTIYGLHYIDDATPMIVFGNRLWDQGVDPDFALPTVQKLDPTDMSCDWGTAWKTESSLISAPRWVCQDEDGHVYACGYATNSRHTPGDKSATTMIT